MSNVQTFPKEPAAAKDIVVREFRQIFFWPLALSNESIGKLEVAKVVDAAAKAIDGKSTGLKDANGNSVGTWRRVDDPINHLSHRQIRIGFKSEEVIAQKQAAYQEYVYFHSFVQRFLYNKGRNEGDANRTASRNSCQATPLTPVQLFTCSGIPTVNVTIRQYDPALDDKVDVVIALDVERLNLYLFDTGVAILTIQVGTSTVTAHPMPYETAAAAAPAARAWVMAARAVRPFRRPVATIEQMSA